MERITQIMEELEMHDEEVLREMYAKLLLENERLETLLNGDDNKKLYEVFESITDYQELVLNDKEYNELEELTDGYEDFEDIELVINKYLLDNGFEYNDNDYTWFRK